MSIFNFFKKTIAPIVTLTKPRAVAFVDYEHWYISLDKMYHMKPDIKTWRNELAQNYDMKDIIFFGDFSNQSLRADIPRIREVSSFIIETQNASDYYEKDFTDFIMLDHIYQKALTSSDIDIFIIFSGDGHFSSAVSFLTTRIGKPVGIYGIKDAISAQLKNSATWTVELPKPDSAFNGYYQMIFRNLEYIDKVNSKHRGSKSYPTFWGTVEAVARYDKIDKEIITDAMRSLIDLGYIYQTQEKINFSKSIKIINVDWKKVIRDGLWLSQSDRSNDRQII